MRFLPFVALTAAGILAACSDSTSPSDTPLPGTIQFTDSSATYIKLGTPSTVSTSADWDVRFTGTTVELNSGSSGSGNVTGYCLCENATKSDAQLLALNPSNTAAAFEAVSATSIPSPSSFVADSVTPVITGWVNGTTAVAANSYLVKLASTPGAQVKFAVTDLPTATTTNPGTVTLTYAYRANTSADFPAGTTTTMTVPITGSAYVSFQNGTPTYTTGTTPPATWDIQITGYKIFVNGGASGSGGATALAFIQGTPNYTTFNLITKALLAPVPSISYTTDASGGVFASTNSARKWYKYDITGTHLITPTFNTYFVSTTTGVYKVQIINYYNTAAIGQHITIRTAKLADAI